MMPVSGVAPRVSFVRFKGGFPQDYQESSSSHAMLNPVKSTIRPEVSAYIKEELLFRDHFKPLSQDLAKFYNAISTVPGLTSEGIYRLLQKKVQSWKKNDPQTFDREMALYKQERGKVLGEKFAHIIAQKIPLDPSKMQVLDVGYGDGYLLSAMKRKLNLNAKQVHGLEVSEIRPIEKEFIPVVYDGNHIPPHVPKPHLVTMNNVLHHFPNKPAVEIFLTSLTRKLKPGGFMLIRDTNASTDKLERINRVKHQLLTKVLPVFPLTMPIDDVYFDEQGWRNLFGNVGLEVMEIIPPEGKPDKSSFFLLKKTEEAN